MRRREWFSSPLVALTNTMLSLRDGQHPLVQPPGQVGRHDAQDDFGSIQGRGRSEVTSTLAGMGQSGQINIVDTGGAHARRQIALIDPKRDPRKSRGKH